MDITNIASVKTAVMVKATDFASAAGDIILWGLVITFALAVVGMIYRRVAHIR